MVREGVVVEATLLADGQLYPASLAVDTANVYWHAGGWQVVGPKTFIDSTNGEVLKCARDGCGGAPTVLVSNRRTRPSNIGTDGKNVYWVDDGSSSDAADNSPSESPSLFHCSVDGCDGNPTLIHATVDTSFAMSGGQLYWGSLNDGVYACADTDCAGTQRTLWAISGQDFIENVIADGDGMAYIISMAPYGLWSCPFSGCNNQPNRVLTAAPQIQGIPSFALATDADNIYFLGVDFSGQKMILQCAKSGCGNAPKTYASGLALYGPHYMASDGISLYWTEVTSPTTSGGQGMIRKCAVPNCGAEPTVVVSGLNAPGPLVLDEDYVYWVDVDGEGTHGQIWRAGK